MPLRERKEAIAVECSVVLHDIVRGTASFSTFFARARGRRRRIRTVEALCRVPPTNGDRPMDGPLSKPERQRSEECPTQRKRRQLLFVRRSPLYSLPFASDAAANRGILGRQFANAFLLSQVRVPVAVATIWPGLRVSANIIAGQRKASIAGRSGQEAAYRPLPSKCLTRCTRRGWRTKVDDLCGCL